MLVIGLGLLFLAGASLGALVRRSGHAVKHASSRVSRERAQAPFARVRPPTA